jgi:hypothetical protein
MRRHRFTARSQLMVVFGLCGAVLVWRTCRVAFLHAPEIRMHRATDTRVDTILFGCALAICENPALDPSRYAVKIWRDLWLPLGVLGLAMTAIVRDPLFHGTFKGTLQGIAFIPLFVVAIRCPSWGPMRL